jgi:hypothetical protein
VRCADLSNCKPMSRVSLFALCECVCVVCTVRELCVCVCVCVLCVRMLRVLRACDVDFLPGLDIRTSPSSNALLTHLTVWAGLTCIQSSRRLTKVSLDRISSS